MRDGLRAESIRRMGGSMYRTIAKIIDINTTTKHGSRLHEKDCAVVGVASSSSAPESDDLYLDLAAVIE